LFFDCAVGEPPSPIWNEGRHPRSAITRLILALVRAPVEPFPEQILPEFKML
jgi:hypothetical protein